MPADKWGYFKVPGCWPGNNNWLQKDAQVLYPYVSWKSERPAGLTSAWYQREITIPADWTGRHIALRAEYVNSYAAVYIDGKKAGEIRFPAGEADLTQVCRPGGKHVLSMLVIAMPLKATMMAFNDTASAKQVRGTVERPGLCGDVYLVATPAGPRINDVKVDTSVRKGEITLDAALSDLAADAQYTLRAEVSDHGRNVKEFTSKPFKSSDLKDGRIGVTEKWKAEKLWDIHTPENMYALKLSLIEAGGKPHDTALPVRFGFRELWTKGRDFMLNGSRIFLSAVPLDNGQFGAAAASYEGAKESLLRLKSFGINFVYTHNYGCEPGTHVSFAEILKAADDVGMLVSFSQPHSGQYNWKAADADQSNGYAKLAEFYVRVAQNHPAVVFYSMNHNSTSYCGDMNPDTIDGVTDPRNLPYNAWARNNTTIALRAEAIVTRLDPSRIVYHHSSGNLSSMWTSNFYPNFVPIQEMSDWFGHWATVGKKPAFTCEYGAPFTYDWAMFRGWYKGQRSFGSARVPWEYCFAEWNSQYLGDSAFKLIEAEKANIRREALHFRNDKVWTRWDYPYELGSRVFDDRFTVMGQYIADNWRAFRTWGLSINSPWEHVTYWKPRDGVDKGRKMLKVDWDNLQRPGFSPDYLQPQGGDDRMDMNYERADWIATAPAKALLRNNMPLLAYIAGKASHFTGKDHNFLPGETIEKQLIVINNSRRPAACECSWLLGLPQALAGTKAVKAVTLETGQQERIPLRFKLPAELAPGKYELTATVKFNSGETQNDSFTVHVLPPPPAAKPAARIALWDPKGETTKLLDGLGLKCQRVEAGANLSGYDVLIVGKAALTVDGPGPNVGNVPSGLKVIVFEQASDVLEKRFGFRVQEYGLRNVFPRVPKHPLLSGLDVESLRDWRGDATLLPPKLKYEMSPKMNYEPTIRWCDTEVTRLWRCGCYGNVASVLIEKPTCGDFFPVVDGGFSLQYSPLMEYRDGRGMVLFCQMDVTGRTEADPAAERLARNIISYVSAWKPVPNRQALYVGDPAGKGHLAQTGIDASPYAGGKLTPDQVLIVGPGGGPQLAAHAAAIGAWLKAGGNLLAIGLDQADVKALLPKIATKKAEHIAAYFEPFEATSPLAGMGPADVQDRDPKEMPLVVAGATIAGDGVLAKADGSNVVFCQLVPWQFDYSKEKYNTKRTFRRAAFLLTRLLGNMGIEGATPVLARFSSPVKDAKADKRWLDGLYLDQPEDFDDPYRFFRW